MYEPEDVHKSSTSVFIRFPLLEITNSKKGKHTIRDLIVKLTMSTRELSGAFKVIVGMSGMRMTLTPEEMDSGYSHSHLPCNRFGGFNSFCLGSSDIAVIKNNLMLNPTVTNWNMFLLAISKYVAWESLEGGPHTQIAGIGSRVSGTSRATNNEIEVDSKKLAENLPSHFVGISDRIVLLESEALNDWINENAKGVRSMLRGGSVSLETYRQRIRASGQGLMWNGSQIPFDVVYKNPPKEEKKDPPLDPAIRDHHVLYINRLLNQFKLIYQHEQYKKIHPRPHYHLGKTKTDTHVSAVGPDRLSPRRRAGS
jgi:hypothetical protein